MNLSTLLATPSWDWPEDAGRTLIETLLDGGAPRADRMLAAELAGDVLVMNDEIARALLEVVQRNDIFDDLRGQAAIALGPVLELCHTEGFDDPDEMVITESTFHLIQDTFRILYRDPDVPNEVRRRALEAAVRAPSDWHKDAVRAAYYSDDPRWKLTAVFAMRFVSTFEEQILEAMESGDEAVRYEAIRAAGEWEIEAAWPQVRRILRSAGASRPLLLAAIDAAGSLGGEEGLELLQEFSNSSDEEIADVADEALLMSASRGWGSLDLDEDEEIEAIWNNPEP